MSDSETNLIRRAQDNDTAAFCSLSERYARRIYLLAFHYCQNAEDAEDLSQEVWLKAYQALRTFRGDSSFYTWLRRITQGLRRAGFRKRCEDLLSSRPVRVFQESATKCFIRRKNSQTELSRHWIRVNPEVVTENNSLVGVGQYSMNDAIFISQRLGIRFDPLTDGFDLVPLTVPARTTHNFQFAASVGFRF